ncbi:MAG TPA: hypothetical protein VG270_07470 [Pseudolabrys sp.]|jgi:hypothetical protein|nr:hypothetical protein [Pseudolabrys sp.]
MRTLIFALTLFSTPVLAQPFAPTTMRVTGTIEAADADSITVRALEGGGTNKVALTRDAKVFGVATTTLAEVKPGAFVGVGATPNADGSQRAIRVTVFAESQRGLGEGFRPWDRAPHGTMTNATVAETVKGIDGQVLTVKYKGGDKRIVVPPDARILAYSVGDRSELKVGAHVAILRAKRKLDGSWETDRVNVGRGGVIPD